jgi:hypothetical protein
VDIENAVQFEARTDVFSTGTTNMTSINVDVEAPVDTVSSITITGPGFADDTPVAKNAQTRTDILEPSPGTTFPYVRDAFFVNSGQITLPTPPATYTFTVTPMLAGNPVYTIQVNGSAGEFISGLSVSQNATSHSAAAVKGQTVTVSWNLPTSYAVEQIELSGSMTDGVTDVFIESAFIGTTATSGSITFTPPAGTQNPQNFNPTNFNLSFEGPNGERTQVIWMFDLP